MIMRHAEKPEKPETGANISKEGHCRAKKLPSLFNGEKLPIPKLLFTFMPTSGRSSLRGLETLLPISEKLDIPIFTYRTTDYLKMTQDIRNRICGETALVVWHHNYTNIGDVLVQLGVDEASTRDWFASHINSYDTVWMVNYGQNGTRLATNLTLEWQGLGADPCNRVSS